MFINWIRNFFNTDKWWGKTIFILVLYFLYWCIFYLIFPYIIILFNNSNFGGVFLFSYLFILAPVISFLILPPFIFKIFNSSKLLLYVLNIIFMIISVFIFFVIVISLSFSNIQIG